MARWQHEQTRALSKEAQLSDRVPYLTSVDLIPAISFLADADHGDQTTLEKPQDILRVFPMLPVVMSIPNLMEQFA